MTISNEETLERPVTFARRGARGTTARFRAGYEARLAHAAGTTLYESFEAAEPVWRAFEARAAGTAFQSFDWLSIWYRHVGERLKRCQRDLVRALGVTTMYWTFDPLVARNAHLNLVRLRASASEYVPNMYGDKTGSPLHGALDTDRIVASWDLAHEASEGPDPAPRPDGAFAVRAATAGGDLPGDVVLHDAPVALIAVPRDLESLPLTTRVVWRIATRRAFTHYLGLGYRVVGFQRARDGHPPYYELAR